MSEKTYKEYLQIIGVLRGKRKESTLEVDLTGIDYNNPKCPVLEHIKDTKRNFRAISNQTVRKYGYRESGEFIFRDLFPVFSYEFNMNN